MIAFFFSYKQALDMLANEEVLAPVYYILGGTKSGEVSEKNNQEIRQKIISFFCVFLSTGPGTLEFVNAWMA